MPVRWRLRQYLERVGVTPYALAKAVGMPLPSMYRLLANPEPRQIDAARLGEFIAALRGMGHDAQLADLLEYADGGPGVYTAASNKRAEAGGTARHRKPTRRAS